MHSVEGNRIVMIDIDTNGRMEERIPGTGQESWLDSTLLGAMYPNIQVALVSIPTETLDDFEEQCVANAMTCVTLNGIAYKMVGASGSAKNGKYYYCDAAHEPLLSQRFQKWPEAAITYFGILVSGCSVVHTESEARVVVVKDLELGTNDCRGWIRKALFGKLQLPEGHFYQFRLAFGETQAKGSFKTMSDDVADALGVDIIIPESSVKPAMKKLSAIASLIGLSSRSFKGEIVVGIREFSQPNNFDGSYTVIQHAPKESLEMEVLPIAVAKIDALKTAWREGSHRKVVELIGKVVRGHNSGEEEFQRVVEAALLADGSGEITRHPYVHAQLSRLMAKWAHKLSTGGGIELPAFALADDGFLTLDNARVVSGADWMWKGTAITSIPSDRGLCVRFPVRMKEDLLPIHHAPKDKVIDHLNQELGVCHETAERIFNEQLMLNGTYTLHSQTASLNGGDYDFDWVCVIDSARFPRFVESRFNMTSEHVVKKTKAERAQSPWFSLEFVALKTRGNQIGVITDLMSSCIAAGRLDLLYELVPQLQLEIDSLKHNTHADRKVLQAIREQVPPAPWLRLKDAKSMKDLPKELEVLATDLIGWLYNIVRKHIDELLEQPMPIQQFRGLIAGNATTQPMHAEARLINTVYAAGHGMIQGKLKQEKTAHDEASARMAEAMRSGDRQKITAERRALSKASARYRRAQEHVRDQAGSLQSIVRSWGDGKETDRMGWCQALHSIVSLSRGEGMGSILFHAFPQEVIDSIAARTGGIRTLVPPSSSKVRVVVEGDALFSVRRNKREPLFRYDRGANCLARIAN
jgi:hypothetical protein